MRQNSIASYINTIKEIPQLTKKEEIKASNEDLVKHNLMFVVQRAHKFKMMLPIEDLIQAGNYGLIIAADRFDRSKKVKFISFAVWYIDKYMRLAINAHHCMTKGGVNKKGRVVAKFYSFDAPLITGAIQRNGSQVGNGTDFTGSPSAPSNWYDIKPDENESAKVFENIALKDDLDILKRFVNSLGETERAILFRRYGFGMSVKMTLKETAKDLKLPVSFVDNTERKAMVKLRNMFLKMAA